MWMLRGRPGLPLASARGALGEIARSRVTLAFLAAVAVLLGYELVLALTVPPNNWDSLWYHLPRAVAWAAGRGVLLDRERTDRPLQRVPAGGRAGAALPLRRDGQGRPLSRSRSTWRSSRSSSPSTARSRRLGFAMPAAACSALLLATFSLFALEASTAQNDLVAASFPAVAACLLLGEGRLEQLLGRRGARDRPRREADDAARVPGRRAAAMPRRAARAPGGRGDGRRLRARRHVGIRPQPRAHRARSRAGPLRARRDTTSPSWPAARSRPSTCSTRRWTSRSSPTGRALTGWPSRAAWCCSSWPPGRGGGSASRRSAEACGPQRRSRAAILALSPAGDRLGSRRWGYPVRGPGGVVGPQNRTANEDFSAFGPIGASARPRLAGARVWTSPAGGRTPGARARARVPGVRHAARADLSFNDLRDALPARAGRAHGPLLAASSGAGRDRRRLLRVAVIVRRPRDRPRPDEAFHLRPWASRHPRRSEPAQEHPGRAPRSPLSSGSCRLTRLRRGDAGAERARLSPCRPRLRPQGRVPPGGRSAVHDGVIKGLFFVVITTARTAMPPSAFQRRRLDVCVRSGKLLAPRLRADVRPPASA